ncbi:uncharacterized protein AC631_01768 [Debaryomyces fabryi]|uniref:Uncharacterized protein n=1 Tax=Debaryomyces fabryi TaxID=58627 RepID=A0A0V1Q2U3_9ASCO|nr:uncharacterized protein AC631_01768 [Debaryomyces fabryi]KSA02495.1 hypothetical protein AC631_01768 [Debaryomyces fabryi]CUM50394.1 unnamed protein product [Debaryomyces fabryi]
MVSDNANDLAVLLNIQTCYHQADILDRAVDFNTSSTGSSWFVITGVIISLFIQVIVAIHSIVTFIFRNRDFEHLGRNIRYLGDNFEILNEKQVELYSTVSSLIGTIKSETRNLHGRLNRGGDVRREIESISENLEKTTIDFSQLKGYFYSSCGPTAAILPPLPAENSAYYKKLPQGRKAHNSYKNNENSKTDNKPTVHKSTGEAVNTHLKLSTVVDNPKAASDIVIDSTQNENSDANGTDFSKSFDISTTEGREKWKKYIREQLIKSKSTQSPTVASNCNSVLKQIDINHLRVENDPKVLNIRYQDVLKRDQNNNKFRRIFILGRGWVSSRKLEQEELKFGPSSFIKLEDPEV